MPDLQQLADRIEIQALASEFTDAGRSPGSAASSPPIWVPSHPER